MARAVHALDTQPARIPHAPECGTEQLTTIDLHEHATLCGQLTITEVMVTRNAQSSDVLATYRSWSGVTLRHSPLRYTPHHHSRSLRSERSQPLNSLLESLAIFGISPTAEFNNSYHLETIMNSTKLHDQAEVNARAHDQDDINKVDREGLLCTYA